MRQAILIGFTVLVLTGCGESSGAGNKVQEDQASRSDWGTLTWDEGEWQ